MPGFDGSGNFENVYSWVEERNDGQVIAADKMDEQDDGIAEGLSNAICKDGQTSVTANIPFANFKITSLGDATNPTDGMNRQTSDGRYFMQTTGAIAAEATVAGASTTDILGAASVRILISGSGATITSLGTGTNRIRFVRLAGTHTLTYNATSLILPGGANITTADGDTMVVCSDGSSNATVYSYERATGSGSLDVELAAIAGLTSAADKLPYFTGSGTAALADFTAAGRALVDDADVAAQKTTLGFINVSTDNAIVRFDSTVGNTQNSGVTIDDSDNLTIPSAAVLTVPNTGLHLLDTDASHDLIVKPGSNLSADHTLTVTTGDSDRTLDLGANLTIQAATTISSYGASLVDDADAATARGTLELATSTTDNAIARFDSTAGKTQDSGVTIDDSNNVSGAASYAASRSDTSAAATLTSTDSGSTVWAGAILDRASTTPANNDLLGKYVLRGRNDAAEAVDYAGMHAQILDTQDGQEDGRGFLSAIVAGAYTDIIKYGPGVQIGSPTNGDKGANTLNVASGIYQNDVQVATLTGTEELTNKTLTTPDINAGTADSLTSLSVRTTGSAHDVTLAVTEVLTAGRTVTLKTNDANRTIDIAGNIALTAGLSTVGADDLTFTTTAATNVTLPTSGTLADIEYGTWTPVLTFATPGDLSVTYSAQVGNYVRLGKMYICTFRIGTSAFTHTTASGICTITGLPGTVSSAYQFTVSLWEGITKANYSVLSTTLVGTTATLKASGSGQAVSNVTPADMPTGGTVTLQGSFVFIIA